MTDLDDSADEMVEVVAGSRSPISFTKLLPVSNRPSEAKIM